MPCSAVGETVEWQTASAANKDDPGIRRVDDGMIEPTCDRQQQFAGLMQVGGTAGRFDTRGGGVAQGPASCSTASGNYPSPRCDSILQRVLKIRSSAKRMAVNFPPREQPVSNG